MLNKITLKTFEKKWKEFNVDDDIIRKNYLTSVPFLSEKNLNVYI